MRDYVSLFFSLLLMLIKLSKPGGIKVVVAENMAMRQQLIVMTRGKRRSPKLNTSDRFLFGLIAFFVNENRLKKIAVILKPTTILKFHKALVNRKYRLLYSNKGNKKPGRKGPDQQLIDLVIEMRRQNPRMGYGRIAMQIYQAFGIVISRFAVDVNIGDSIPAHLV